MNVRELIEQLEDHADHLEVVCEWLDEPREYYFEIVDTDTPNPFYQKLVLSLEKVGRPD